MLEFGPVCLGTVSFGNRNSEQEGLQLLDAASAQNIHFWDTAEMYPSPPRPETFGASEKIIGKWFASRRRRQDIILATKIAGWSGGLYPWIRGSENRLNRKNIHEAINGSLRRLRTDYIDLVQTHWPDRHACKYGLRTTIVPPIPDETPIEETLDALNDAVRAGKVRAIGVSNETPWGVMQHLRIAEKNNWPLIASVQNGYNLLNRLAEEGLAETCTREKLAFLAYSPLAAGALTGKYLNGVVPEGSRRAVDPRKPRYASPNADQTIQKYIAAGTRYGLTPIETALGWVVGQDFITSTIVSATSLEQLNTVIMALRTKLPTELVDEINQIHKNNPNPSP